MGHLTNPIGFRVGRTQKWKSLWASSPAFYAVQSRTAERVAQYFKSFFGFILGNKFRDKGLVYSHVWLRSKVNRLVITVFLYSGNLVKIQKRKYLKFLSYVNSPKAEKVNLVTLPRGGLVKKAKVSKPREGLKKLFTL